MTKWITLDNSIYHGYSYDFIHYGDRPFPNATVEAIDPTKQTDRPRYPDIGIVFIHETAIEKYGQWPGSVMLADII